MIQASVRVPDRTQAASIRRMRIGALATLTGLSLLTLVAYFQLARVVRFPPDDLCAFSYVQSKGIAGTQARLFKTWSGRWASNLFIASVMATYSAPGSLFAYSLLLFAIVSMTAWAFCRTMLERRVEEPALTLAAWATTALLFLSSPHRADNWFFAYSSVENLWPICLAALSLVALRLARRRPGWLIVACAFAAFGSAGHQCVALPFLVLLGTLLVATWVPFHEPMLSTGDRQRLGVVAISAGVSFLVCVMAPGDRARLAVLGPVSVSQAITHSVLGGPGLLLTTIADHVWPLLAVLLVWASVAALFGTGLHTGQRRTDLLRLGAGMALLLWATSAAVTFPGYYALDRLPPGRAQIALTVVLVGVLADLGRRLGLHARRDHRRLTVLLSSTGAVALILVLHEAPRIVGHVEMLRAYAAAYDERLDSLRAMREAGPHRDIVRLERLPAIEPFRTAEISSTDRFAYPNACLKMAMRMQGSVLAHAERNRPAAPAL